MARSTAAFSSTFGLTPSRRANATSSRKWPAALVAWTAIFWTLSETSGGSCPRRPRISTMPAITCSELLTSCATEGSTMPVVVMRLMYARSAVENARSVVTGAAVSVWSVMAEGNLYEDSSRPGVPPMTQPAAASRRPAPAVNT